MSESGYQTRPAQVAGGEGRAGSGAAGGAEVWPDGMARAWPCGYLERKGDEHPRTSAQWLLSEACGLSRIELYARFDQPLSMAERDVLRDYVRRRGAGEPLQFITGEVGFRHITVRVRPGVLIPRPETEVLVSEALALLPAPPRPRAKDDEELLARLERAAAEAAGEGGESVGASEALEALEARTSSEAPSASSADEPEELLVADLCTGTGCIACSIAGEHPRTRIVATDIAPAAVALARENAAALGLEGRVEVLECDLGEAIPDALMGAFDLVVSNPPYVPTGVLADIPREVADFEPALALDGGVDGLAVARRMLPWCTRALKPGGALALELHETCLDAAAGLVRAAGFADVRIAAALAGRPRVRVARKPAASRG